MGVVSRFVDLMGFLQSGAGMGEVKTACSMEAPEQSDSRATADSPASAQTKVLFPGGSDSVGTAAAASKPCSRKRKVGMAF